MNTQKAMAAVLASRSERETEQRDTAQPRIELASLERCLLRYKAHAERLAEALADLRSRVVAEKVDCLNTVKADEALAAWEGAQK